MAAIESRFSLAIIIPSFFFFFLLFDFVLFECISLHRVVDCYQTQVNWRKLFLRLAIHQCTWVGAQVGKILRFATAR